MNLRTILVLIRLATEVLPSLRCATGAVLSMAIATVSMAGTFDPQVGQPGSLAIADTSSSFVEWASSVSSLVRGPEDAANPGLGLASFGTAANAIGSPVGNLSRLVSLGDGGSITVGFENPVKNGPGADFAVFENGFASGGSGLAFLELGLVAVSSDGINFFTFPAVSETQTTTQLGNSGLIDATNLYDLAGKYTSGYGTGFDLSELANVSPLLNVNDITAVRITDVVGSIDPALGTKDSLGNLINDPFPTPFASSGFDLNAVGVINAVTGDVTGDGVVNGQDIALVASHWLQDTSVGDTNGDGIVNGQDIAIIASHWLDGTGSGSSVAGVPEPGTLGLAALGLAIFVLRIKLRR